MRHDALPPVESEPEARVLRESDAFEDHLEFERHLQLVEMGYGFPIELCSRFMTPYEWQASHAEGMNRWVLQDPVSLRHVPQVLEIRRDQALKRRERRAQIFAEHEWVEVINAHPISEEGLATQPVETGFSVASSNQLFPES